MTFATLDDLLKAVLLILPDATAGEDNDGQVIIYTGLRQRSVLERMDGPTPDFNPNGWRSPDQVLHFGEFYEVKVVFDRSLTDEELEQAAGCIAYAFKANLRGERAGQPERLNDRTFTFYYDITKSRSDDWAAHFDDAIEDAAEYCLFGTPERKSDHKRLIEPVGKEPIEFWFR